MMILPSKCIYSTSDNCMRIITVSTFVQLLSNHFVFYFFSPVTEMRHHFILGHSTGREASKENIHHFVRHVKTKLITTFYTFRFVTSHMEVSKCSIIWDNRTLNSMIIKWKYRKTEWLMCTKYLLHTCISLAVFTDQYTRKGSTSEASLLLNNLISQYNITIKCKYSDDIICLQNIFVILPQI